MPDWLVFAPGIILLTGSLVVTFSGSAAHSSARVFAANRLRYLAIAVFLIVPGIQLAVVGLLNGPRWGQTFLGLIVIGFGGLWLIGRSGVPKGPSA
jgi:hypothetical protein